MWYAQGAQHVSVPMVIEACKTMRGMQSQAMLRWVAQKQKNWRAVSGIYYSLAKGGSLEQYIRKVSDFNDVGIEDYTLLAETIYHKQHTALRMLLAAKADPNARNRRKCHLPCATALHHAALRGDEVATRILLEAGADPNLRDLQGLTPLHIASRDGNKDVVIELLKHKTIDLNAQCAKKGYTALMRAAYRGASDIVQLLMRAGADLNKRDHENNTALIWSIFNHKWDVEHILIEARADTTIESKKYGTADQFKKDQTELRSHLQQTADTLWYEHGMVYEALKKILESAPWKKYIDYADQHSLISYYVRYCSAMRSECGESHNFSS